MSNKSERSSKSPKAAIEAYIEATRLGDVPALKSSFTPSALMSGYFEGEFYSGTPEPFFDEVRDNPSPAESGKAYEGSITYVEVVGEVAQVTMKETGYLGLDFTNLFHLALVDDKWQILSKTYIDQTGGRQYAASRHGTFDDREA